jgi:hypothetical protein
MQQIASGSILPGQGKACAATNTWTHSHAVAVDACSACCDEPHHITLQVQQR